MPRPCKRRRVRFRSRYDHYKPAGVSLQDLREISLQPDELEAIRLADLQGLNQEKAAERMEISQPTFNRVLSSARKKVAEALVNGLALRIKKLWPLLMRGQGFEPWKALSHRNLSPARLATPASPHRIWEYELIKKTNEKTISFSFFYSSFFFPSFSFF